MASYISKKLKVGVEPISSTHKQKMDPPIKSRKKKDKAKEKLERNGGHSQKHVRLVQLLQEKKKG
jgi:hypothetical protein